MCLQSDGDVPGCCYWTIGLPPMAKALRALDALPDAPTGLAREAGAALSAIVSRRADGGGPTSG